MFGAEGFDLIIAFNAREHVPLEELMQLLNLLSRS